MEKLKDILRRIDGKSYKAYKDIQGTYPDKNFTLHIDYVQPDPFANPSRIRIEIPRLQIKYKDEWHQTAARKTAFEDFLTREIANTISSLDTRRTGSGKSGILYIDRPGQEVLPRTAVKVTETKIEICLSLGLPAQGRRIMGRQAAQLFCEDLPQVIKEAVFQINQVELNRHLELSDQQETIRNYITQRKYICFIAKESILPRESGISNLPLKGPQVIPFISPKSLEIEITIPHRKPIKGMAIPEGVTLIVGGGYNGKSTLLKAIERGVYNHIPGDGREYVITNPSAYKIRAEDGRRVEKVNISPFISNLPFGKDTTQFSTDDASGSTSQAANIIEALEVESKVLLIDEDTSATNFMIRDARMQELVGKDKEPITPFIDKVRQLYQDYQVSTVLVIGGSGDYFDVADRVLMMNEYQPIDVTTRARKIITQFSNPRHKEGGDDFGELSQRVLLSNSFNASRGRSEGRSESRKERVDSKGLHTIIYGRSTINLTSVEQLVDSSQTRAIANMIKYIANELVDGKTELNELLNQVYQLVERKGLAAISPYYGKHPGDMALPRKQELAAAINRLRTIRVK